jgi:hypothetical protein
MIEIYENRQRLPDDVVRFSPLHVHHKPDAARIVFVLRIVKPLFLRWSLIVHFVVDVASQERRGLTDGFTRGNDKKDMSAQPKSLVNGSFNMQMGAGNTSIALAMTEISEPFPICFAARK